MQKAPVMKGSGLKPLEENKSNEEVHVFGKNLEERVVAEDEAESSSISFNSIQNSQESQEDDIESIRKRKFDAKTGEEDEETIFQGEFKLFVWDLSTSNWIEKGRGQLKLNDAFKTEERKSRLIMRVSGTLRIILNVAIKPSYFRVIANSKSNIRFTDSLHVWAASGSNANQLRDLIEERLEIIAQEEKVNKRTNSGEDEDDELTKTKKTKVDQPTNIQLLETDTKTEIETKTATETETATEEAGEEDTPKEEEREANEEKSPEQEPEPESNHKSENGEGEENREENEGDR